MDWCVMDYNKINYLDKIEALQSVYKMSTALAEAIGINRRTILNWKDKPESIKSVHRLSIDTLYCTHFVIPEWDDPSQKLGGVLLPDRVSNNNAVFDPFIRRMSFGTIEIETDMCEADFDRVIDTDKLPRNMTRKEFHEAWNAFVTVRKIWHQIIEQHELFILTEEAVKGIHESFMRGIYENAGYYSKNIRLIGGLSHFDTTLPEDVPEEMVRWVFKSKGASTLEEIAIAHAYFIAIHPFGDGNGRVGRAIVMAQCLNSRLMPPMLTKENRAMYFAAMEYALKHGRHTPLVRLFHEASTVVVPSSKHYHQV